MTEHCPHCGAKLPEFRDAFCPECRQPWDEPPVAYSESRTTDAPPVLTTLDISGAENLTVEQLASEIKDGARLVIYQYCISIGILTFLKPSRIHLVRAGESSVAKGLPYTLLSLIAGWWGFPWGFIHTPIALVRNLSGGINITSEFVSHLQREHELSVKSAQGSGSDFGSTAIKASSSTRYRA